MILFSLVCFVNLKDIKFDYDFEAFFPNEDKELELYNNYRKTFGFDNEFVLICFENKKGIFQMDFLQKVDKFTQELSEIENIVRVNSPTNLKSIAWGGLMPIQKRVMHFEDPEMYKEDSIEIYNTPHLVGSFFPANAKSLSIFAKTKDVLSKNKSDSLAIAIEKAIYKYGFDEVHFVGRVVGQKIYLENLQKEFVVFILLSFAVIIIFLWFSFRSLYGVVVPVVIVLVSILWTLGIMKFTGKSIDIMTVMLPTMMFVAGMSDVVHFFTKYFEEVAKGTPKANIYPLILKEVGFPTFLTLVTTVVGFLSLLFSSITPIRDFGIYTSIGVVIAFILSYTFLPALLYFFTPKKLVTVHGTNNRTTNVMRTGLFWIFRNQKTILVITAVVMVLSVIGMFKIKVNNILLEDLSDEIKIKRDFNFFDEHYSGVRPFEVEITLKDKTKKVWDRDVVLEINKVDEFIKKEYGAGFILSLPQIVKSIHRSMGEIYSMPNDSDYLAIKKAIIDNKKNRDLKQLVNVEGDKTKISAKTRDMGSMLIAEHNKHLFEFIDKSVNKDLLEFNITGAAHLMDRNNEYMVSNMTQGFAFSVIIIAFLTFFLHRSWRMVLVFVLPNLIPLVIIAGLMGYMGIELKAATSLVFSIAFGIATDDTIHFISRLKIELGYGKSLMYAFKRTYFETGKPIILTTFILLGGFMSLMTSNFQSTYYFGFLICVTIIVAVLADIFLLPVLLFLIYRKTKTKE